MSLPRMQINLTQFKLEFDLGFRRITDRVSLSHIMRISILHCQLHCLFAKYFELASPVESLFSVFIRHLFPGIHLQPHPNHAIKTNMTAFDQWKQLWRQNFLLLACLCLFRCCWCCRCCCTALNISLVLQCFMSHDPKMLWRKIF